MAPTTPLPDLIGQYLAAKEAAGLSPRTLGTYGQRLAYFATWLDGRPLDRAAVRAYVQELRRRNLSAETVHDYARDVHTFCAWLVEEDLAPTNPAHRLVPKRPNQLPASYSKAQIRALLAGADLRERALILVLLDTGLRAAELVSLRKDRIDWTSGHTTVIGKGRKERPVFIGPTALEAVRAYVATRDDDDPELWVGRRGGLTANGVHQIVKHRAEAAGIRQDVRRLLHSFRASFAKHYLQRGGDLETLRSLLGHASISMAAYYGQLNDSELERKKRAVDPLAAIDD